MCYGRDNELFWMGWQSKLFSSKRHYSSNYELKQVGVDGELLIDLNDSGFTFNEIADFLERTLIPDLLTVRRYD